MKLSVVYVVIAGTLGQMSSAESGVSTCSEASEECAAMKQNMGTKGSAMIQTKRVSKSADVVWPQLGDDHQKCIHKGCNTILTQKKCQEKAVAEGYTYFSFEERRGCCVTSSSCTKPIATKPRNGVWRIFHQAVTPAPTPLVTPSPTPPYKLKCAHWCKTEGSSWKGKCNWGDEVCSECDECVYAPFPFKLPKPATEEFPDARTRKYANWECETICKSRSELVEGLISKGCCEWTPDGGCNFYPNGAINRRGQSDATVWDCKSRHTGIGSCSGWTDGKTCSGGDADVAVQFVPAEGSTSYLMQTNHKLILDWSDEFDNCPGGLPDPSIWTFEDAAREERLQWYTEKNAKCVDGKLVIEAREETPMEAGYGPWESRWNAGSRVYAAQHKYTSSSITSKGKKSFLLGGRGKAELRARVDVRSGAFPAWWSMGEPDDFNPPCHWPGCGEIDMMEYVGGTGWMKTNFCHAHGGDAECSFGDWCHCKWHYAIKAVNETWSKEFHTWAMEWDENEDIIQMTLDGALLIGQTFSEADPVNTGRPENPFRNKRNYMILNLALGFVGGDPSPTQFPMKFEIDYLRIYKEA